MATLANRLHASAALIRAQRVVYRDRQGRAITDPAAMDRHERALERRAEHERDAARHDY